MTEPVGYLNFGWSYIRSAELLHAGQLQGKYEIRFEEPIITLIGHGIELMLKAYIWHTTSQPAPFDHDLMKLFKMAKGKDLPLDLSDSELLSLSHLNDYVGKFPYEGRYLVTGPKQAPELVGWISLSRRLMDAAQPAICPDRFMNVGLQTRLEPRPSYPPEPLNLSVEQAVDLIMTFPEFSICAPGDSRDLPSPLAGEGSGMGGVARIEKRGST